MKRTIFTLAALFTLNALNAQETPRKHSTDTVYNKNKEEKRKTAPADSSDKKSKKPNPLEIEIDTVRATQKNIKK